MNYLFSAYGLTIASELPLLHTQPLADKPDIRIRFKDFKPESEVQLNGIEQLYGALPNIADFLVQKGCELIVYPVAGVDPELLRVSVLAAGMAVILRQRGYLILHGSSVCIGSEAIAFLGHSGWGKSTLATAFHSQGHDLITDDVLAIDIQTEGCFAIPSYPLVKLLPDSAATAATRLSSPIGFGAATNKCIHPVETQFFGRSIPLKKLYLLGGKLSTIEPVSGTQAFMSLVSYSRTMNTLVGPDFMRTHFEQCQHLLKTVPVAQLPKRQSLQQLPELINTIKTDLG